MNVPDRIQPIVAHRAWKLGRDGLLHSPSDHGGPWRPGLAYRAACVRDVCGSLPHADRAPELDCTCGVYALRERRDVPLCSCRVTGSHSYPSRGMLPVFSPEYVIGTVALWGKVVEHDRGYRAEQGYPLELCLAADHDETGRLARRIGSAYGVPTVVGHRVAAVETDPLFDDKLAREQRLRVLPDWMSDLVAFARRAADGGEEAIAVRAIARAILDRLEPVLSSTAPDAICAEENVHARGRAATTSLLHVSDRAPRWVSIQRRPSGPAIVICTTRGRAGAGLTASQTITAEPSQCAIEERLKGDYRNRGGTTVMLSRREPLAAITALEWVLHTRGPLAVELWLELLWWAADRVAQVASEREVLNRPERNGTVTETVTSAGGRHDPTWRTLFRPKNPRASKTWTSQIPCDGQRHRLHFDGRHLTALDHPVQINGGQIIQGSVFPRRRPRDCTEALLFWSATGRVPCPKCQTLIRPQGVRRHQTSFFCYSNRQMAKEGWSRASAAYASSIARYWPPQYVVGWYRYYVARDFRVHSSRQKVLYLRSPVAGVTVIEIAAAVGVYRGKNKSKIEPAVSHVLTLSAGRIKQLARRSNSFARDQSHRADPTNFAANVRTANLERLTGMWMSLTGRVLQSQLRQRFLTSREATELANFITVLGYKRVLLLGQGVVLPTVRGDVLKLTHWLNACHEYEETRKRTNPSTADTEAEHHSR